MGVASAAKGVVKNMTKGLAGASKLQMGGMVLNGIMMGTTIVSDIKEGQSFGAAALKGIGEFALMEAMPSVFWGMTAAQLAGIGIEAGYNKIQERNQFMRQNSTAQPRFNYVDTESAYTMRSAAVQAIQGSKMNARSALGGEARLLQRREAYNRI